MRFGKLIIGAVLFGLLALTLAIVAFPNDAKAAPGYQQCDSSSPPLCAPFAYRNITTTATTVVKSGAGWLHSVCINKPVASSVITLYDNTAGSGTVIATITLPATLLAEGGNACEEFDIAFGTGLTIVTA